MPGARSVSLTNPYIVQLFRRALWQQSGWILLGALGLAVFFSWRWSRLRLAAPVEHKSRTYLRWGFGLFWIIDGLLQLQPSMPLGLGNLVVAPAASGTPHWISSLVLSGVGIWNRHPLALAPATAWIQLGIGLWLVSSAGIWSRFAGAFSAGWALLIWIVGSAFGGVFSPGASFLFGWPGPTSFYFVAGVFLALRPSVFPEKFSRVTLRLIAVLMVGAVVVQSWPDHQFWHGGSSNALTAMTTTMTQSSQPGWFSWLVIHGGLLGQQLGGGFNVIVIIWLTAGAIGPWTRSTREIV